MAIVKITKVGLLGVQKDRNPSDLPYNAWSDSLHMRIKDDTVKSAPGSVEVNLGTVVSPYYLMNFTVAGSTNLIYAGLSKIYSVVASVHTNRTRQTAAVDVDYNANPGGWTGGPLGGVPVLNNLNDYPQSYNFTTGLFEDLPAWDVTHTCSVMRPFREFLVALNVTKDSVRYPHLVKWSHPADPGTVPVSWDITDPTKDAGEYPLIDSGGEIVDLVPLRDFAIIYKTEAMYSMQYIGAPFIFSFKKMNFGFGLLNANCVAEVRNGHFVVTNEDIIWHNGVEYQQIGPKRVNDWVFNSMNRDAAHTAFVAVDRREQNIWFCFPAEDSELPNKALIWNWTTDTFMITEIEGLSHLLYGLPSDEPPAIESWDDLTPNWNDASLTWGQRAPTNLGWDFIGAQPDVTTPKLLSLSSGNTNTGVARRCYVERTGLPLAGKERDGTPKLDLESWKLFKAIWPKIKISTGHTIDIYVGSQVVPEGAVTWTGPYPFNPETMNKINCLVSGRFLCMRFETFADVAWELLGYDVDVELTGVY